MKNKSRCRKEIKTLSLANINERERETHAVREIEKGTKRENLKQKRSNDSCLRVFDMRKTKEKKRRRKEEDEEEEEVIKAKMQKKNRGSLQT